jgi:hypothetical protein
MAFDAKASQSTHYNVQQDEVYLQYYQIISSRACKRSTYTFLHIGVRRGLAHSSHHNQPEPSAAYLTTGLRGSVNMLHRYKIYLVRYGCVVASMWLASDPTAPELIIVGKAHGL